MKLEGGDPPGLDPEMQDERCVVQIVRRHFARYTPELVSELCGCSQEDFLEVARALCESSGRERTGAIVYAVGWTQHTTGVQNVRAASIVQLLLGNIGRPGGGILALRGHANIQGSTDIPTLYNILPGYIPMPHPRLHPTLDEFVARNGPETGAWGDLRPYIVSLLKAWWGDAATAENAFCFHHRRPLALRDDAEDARRGRQGHVLRRAEPARRLGQLEADPPRPGQARLAGGARPAADRVGAVSGRTRPSTSPEKCAPRTSRPRSSSCPPPPTPRRTAASPTPNGCCSGNHKACQPPGEARSELHWIYHLGRAIRARLAASEDPRDRPILDLTWDYPVRGPHDEPEAAAVLQEISGRKPDGALLSSSDELRGEGSTACGSWIHCGIYAEGVNRAARRRPASEQNWIAPEWGWAWPKNTRIIYNRASADPDGKPWSERKRYVWWDAEQGRWTGLGDAPDFPAAKEPGYRPAPGAKGMEAIAGDKPFILHPDGRGWIFVPTGLVDGPLPTHYEPQESPFGNSLYTQQRNPTRQLYDRPENRYHPTAGENGAEVFPFALSTYRLTEHHTAGAMSRNVPYLAEPQPEFFCEVSPQLASLRGLEHGGWATIATARSVVEARVLVTERIKPLVVHDAPRGGAVSLGWGGDRDWRLCQRAPSARARRQCPHQRVQGRDLRHPPRASPAGPRPAEARRVLPPSGGSEDLKLQTHAWPASYGERSRPRMGFFTDTSICIGCQACEVACKEWNQIPMSLQGFSGSPMTTRSRSMPTPGATSRSSSRSCPPTERCFAPSSGRSSCRRMSATAAATASRRVRSGFSTSAAPPAKAVVATGGCGSARSATTASRTTCSPPARRRARPTRSSSASSRTSAITPSSG